MTAVIVLLLILLVALFISRIATIALMATGMSRQYAKFQSRSAFTGAGFTTSEAEAVVSHPVRRRIVMALMLMGNAGIATVVATLLLGFTDADTSDQLIRSGVLIAGLVGIWLLAANQRLESAIRRAFVRVLRGNEDLLIHDYASLLHVGHDYTVGEIQVQEDDWMSGRTLAQMHLRDEGVIVLGIERGGEFLGTPHGDSLIKVGDTLILYGTFEALSDLDDRRKGISGELSHVDQVIEHHERARAERTEDKPDDESS